MRAQTTILTIIFWGLTCFYSSAQEKNWRIGDCINYALEHNIQVQKANLSTNRNEIQVNQAKSNLLPSVGATVRQNFGWNKSKDLQTGDYGNLSGSSSTNYSLNSSITVFNGFKIKNTIKQSELNLEASKLYAETVMESIELNIVSAFLQVIYAEEQVKNANKQMEVTTEQLNLAKERLSLSAISKSDYLQIESQLASEKLTYANAQSQLTMSRVNLMQLMELPVTDTFDIASPNIDAMIQQEQDIKVSEIFDSAIKNKPQIKYSQLNTESSKLDIKIAMAGLFPTVSLDAGIGTGYSSLNSEFNYLSQLDNGVNPSLGVTLSIPIFQKNQVRSNIALSKIGVKDAELDELNTRNQLRKEIEQATEDALSAKTQYYASIEQLRASTESYQLAEEKFKLGSLNSVDFLFEKTKLISAESQLLQSKYNLVFSNKIIDFYRGVSLTF